MTDLRTALAPLIDGERLPTLDRIRAAASRRRRRRVTVRSAVVLVAVVAALGVWIGRPAAAPSVRTIDSSATTLTTPTTRPRPNPTATTSAPVTTTSPPRSTSTTAPRTTVPLPTTVPSVAPTATDPSVSAAIGAPGFTSPSTGWVCGSPLRFTSDDGSNWQTIALGIGTAVVAQCAFAPGHAWVAVNGQGVHRTAAVVRVIAGAAPRAELAALPGAAANETLQSLAFVDAAHGWALTETTTADSQLAPGVLYATADGGAHWQRVAVKPPVLSGLRFSSATTGWGIDGGNLERTTDGGRTWHAAPTVTPPNFGSDRRGAFESVFTFGSRIVADGFVPTGNFGELFTEVSSDGGAHWSLAVVSTAIIEPAGTLQRSFVAVDAVHWRYSVGDRLAVTDDAGHSWRVVTTGPINEATGISFVSPSVGWAAGCVVGTDPCAGVAQTTDSGSTWHSL